MHHPTIQLNKCVGMNSSTDSYELLPTKHSFIHSFIHGFFQASTISRSGYEQRSNTYSINQSTYHTVTCASVVFLCCRGLCLLRLWHWNKDWSLFSPSKTIALCQDTDLNESFLKIHFPFPSWQGAEDMLESSIRNHLPNNGCRLSIVNAKWPISSIFFWVSLECPVTTISLLLSTLLDEVQLPKGTLVAFHQAMVKLLVNGSTRKLCTVPAHSDYSYGK